MLTEYRRVFESPVGSGPGIVRYELTNENELLLADQTPKPPGEIIDYRVECDCGDTFWAWSSATEHVESEHLGETVEISN